MASYNIPRNTKGEGRILFIFSTKALVYTIVGVGIGSIFYLIFRLIGLGVVGVVLMSIFGFLGFAAATFKVPQIRGVKATKDVGGEKIDEIITRAIKFKLKKTKQYVLYNSESKTSQVNTTHKGGNADE